jgi:hypothetical protein
MVTSIVCTGANSCYLVDKGHYVSEINNAKSRYDTT